jgi:thiol-disulfide isomerase/thioredoxin
MRVLPAVAMALLLPVLVLVTLRPAIAADGHPFAPAPTLLPAPAMSFVDGSGHRLGLEAFAGKLVLLTLWATWCPPCVEEMPALDRLEARLGGAGFQVVAVSVDRGGRETVQPFLQRHALDHLAVYLDPDGAALRAWDTNSLPTSVLIDPDGRVLGRIEGEADWNAPEALALIQHFLTRPAPTPPPRHGGVINTSG